jgi:hypothetical protein
VGVELKRLTSRPTGRPQPKGTAKTSPKGKGGDVVNPWDK